MDLLDDLDLRRATRVLLGLAWLGLPLWCTGEAFLLLFHLFGESATAAEQAGAARWLTGGIVAAVGIPVVALLLGGRRAWVVALVLGSLYGGLAGALVADLTPDRPAPPAPYVCQERSGGDSDCPGG